MVISSIRPDNYWYLCSRFLRIRIWQINADLMFLNRGISYIRVIRVLFFTPDSSFDVIGIAEYDPYDFILNVWHGIVVNLAEASICSVLLVLKLYQSL